MIWLQQIVRVGLAGMFGEDLCDANLAAMAYPLSSYPEAGGFRPQLGGAILPSESARPLCGMVFRGDRPGEGCFEGREVTLGGVAAKLSALDCGIEHPSGAQARTVSRRCGVLTSE